MKVVNNDQTYRVFWMYNHTDLAKYIGAYVPNTTMVQGMEMPLKKQLEKVGVKPVEWKFGSNQTFCFLADSEGNIIGKSAVKRHYQDPEDRDKARKYSLAKLLKEQFPGVEGKKVRTEFWKAYLDRVNVQEAKTIPISALGPA